MNPEHAANGLAKRIRNWRTETPEQLADTLLDYLHGKKLDGIGNDPDASGRRVLKLEIANTLESFKQFEGPLAKSSLAKIAEARKPARSDDAERILAERIVWYLWQDCQIQFDGDPALFGEGAVRKS